MVRADDIQRLATAGDSEKSIEAGCNDYISKPINKAELLEKIGKCVSHS